MLFPDCRNDQTYNEDFLNAKYKECVWGYDWAVQHAEGYFDNVCESELFGELANHEKVSPIIEAILETIKEDMQAWLEMERNEMITSMVDGMDDDEFEALRDKAIKEHPDKKYYDTRNLYPSLKRGCEDDGEKDDE